ncbi:hypothetical protein CHS0354_023692 [Potamilus streckersoni]|uniref:Uncharacterized protein n=1 Tax=Potamilus streckersoni TaxID=2493646 RepID=A0AAE0VTT9_9BIVA|nr:hypothetical protein CHS0354_023692 [Potamilus streckersoni]
MLCNYRGRGKKINTVPRFPREMSACKADFVSASHGKGRARIIRDNMLLTKDKAQVGLPKNHQVIMDKPAPVFSKTETKYSESWNNEDFPALGSAAVKGSESAVLSRGKPMNSSNQSIQDTHRVNNAAAVFSDSVSCRPDNTKSIKETSKTSQVPARVKDSLKSLNRSTIAWYMDMITTSQKNSAFQLPKDSDMFHKETTYLSGAKSSYDESLMNRYLRNSLDSSIGSHFSSRSVAGSILVRNELPHLKSDDQLSCNVRQSSSFNDNTDVYTHLDMARNNNDLKDNIIANSNNDQCVTLGIINQFSSEGEKSDLMHKHIDYSLVTNYNQSDVNVKTSNIKGENTDKSDDNNGSLERKKYKKKIIPESNSSDCHKWKVKGEFVIQVDGLPPNPDLSGLVDLIASFGTVYDQEVSNNSTSSSARFK